MTDLEGAESSCDTVAKLAKNGHNAVLERRCAALGQPLADGQQCVGGKAGPITATVDDAWADAHLRFLRVRGARRFSRSRSALTRRLARLRSVTMPDFLPYSWPLKKARPTREAVMPVPTMMLNGSMCFISWFVLARHTGRAKICGLVWPCRRPARFLKPDWPRRAQTLPVAEPLALRQQVGGRKQEVVLARLSAYYGVLFRLHDKLSATNQNGKRANV